MESSRVNQVYIYDLSKESFSSQKLAYALKEQAGVIIEEAPIIKRDAKKLFYTGFIKIKCESQKDYIETCERIRYFTLDGKQCRALRFDKEIQEKSDKPNT